ncbi:MAG: MBL fold metallo-hydrolase [Dehalococcoidia bacterium]|nr:MBL fold metallo-hydrolase [Dehalococcoidia bacterium]
MSVTITTLVENTAGVPNVIGEWGQSLLIEADGKKVLFDTGPSGAILDNARNLNVDLTNIDVIVISHGHYDHTGGLKAVLALIQKAGTRPDGIEIIGHHDIFQHKSVYIKGMEPRYIGSPFSRSELEALGARFNLSDKPVKISENILTTGEVEVTNDFEKIDAILHVLEGDQHVPDPVSDDLSIIIKTEKGLIVLLGCAHRGIINNVRHAQKITGIDRVYAVIGGTHLFSAGPEQMAETIKALRQMNIQKLGASHCTGMKSAATLAREFENTFFFNNAGVRTTL